MRSLQKSSGGQSFSLERLRMRRRARGMTTSRSILDFSPPAPAGMVGWQASLPRTAVPRQPWTLSLVALTSIVIVLSWSQLIFSNSELFESMITIKKLICRLTNRMLWTKCACRRRLGSSRWLPVHAWRNIKTNSRLAFKWSPTIISLVKVSVCAVDAWWFN